MDKGEFFKGASVKPTGKGPISVKGIVSPKKKENKTTDDKDVTAGISGNQPSLGDGVVKPACDPEKNVSIAKPVQKESFDNMFKFDKIWRELTEAEDAPIGGDLNAANANMEGDSFDDEAGDFNPIDDQDTDDAEDGIDEETAVDALRRIRDEINDILGDSDLDDDSDLLDDTDSELEADDTGTEEPPASAAAPAGPPPPAPQVESLQHKTKFGPKMSDKAPGRLGKRKGSGKLGKGSLKKGVTAQDAKGKKVPLSKFNPKMSDKVSRLKKGELF